MKMAEKFGIPVVTLIDTPGAILTRSWERAKERCTVRNIFEMVRLKVPIITIIVEFQVELLE
jgi:acetyl-CoA carboxylase carboxyl transferase subunit alpha